MKLSNLNEIQIINNISKLIKVCGNVKVGIGDDAGVIKSDGGRYLLFTTDMLLEDVHFKLNLKETTPEKIGRKSLAVNLSDIAAMGGVPKYVVVSVAIPKNYEFDFLDRIYNGMKTIAEEFNVDIVGGDITSADKLIINIALIGDVVPSNLVLRSNAKPGDSIFVTGTLGGSYHGKHFNFLPRLRESHILTDKFEITSMIDISDGLIYDAYRVALASNVRLEFFLEKIPLSKEAKSLENALYDGEDFELLFTVEKKDTSKLLQNTKILGKTLLTHIGYVREGEPEVSLVDKKGKRVPVGMKGYDHFQGCTP